MAELNHKIKSKKQVIKMRRSSPLAALPARYSKEEVSSNEIASSYFIDLLLQNIDSIMRYIQLSQIDPEADFNDIARHIQSLNTPIEHMIEIMDFLNENVELDIKKDERCDTLRSLLIKYHQGISKHLEDKNASKFRLTLYDLFKYNDLKMPKCIKEIPLIEDIKELRIELLKTLKESTARNVIIYLNQTQLFSLDTKNQPYSSNPFEIIASRDDFFPNEKAALYSELAYHLITNGKRKLIPTQHAIEILSEESEKNAASIMILQALRKNKMTRFSSMDCETETADNGSRTSTSSSDEEWVMVDVDATVRPTLLTQAESERGVNACLQKISPYTREKDRSFQRILVHFMRKPNGKSAIAFRLYLASTVGIKRKVSEKMLSIIPKRGIMREYSKRSTVSLFALIDSYGSMRPDLQMQQ